VNILQPWNIAFLAGLVIYFGIRHVFIKRLNLMMLQNWLAGWSTVVAFTAMYFLRTPREEQLMCETFGEEYRQSMRRTGRLVPRIARQRG
jgi:protein-S-isoprenylcysteine O-methyltransferase Ste14